MMLDTFAAAAAAVCARLYRYSAWPPVDRDMSDIAAVVVAVA